MAKPSAEEIERLKPRPAAILLLIPVLGIALIALWAVCSDCVKLVTKVEECGEENTDTSEAVTPFAL